LFLLLLMLSLTSVAQAQQAPPPLKLPAEPQLPLTVDRDPVPSPDEVNLGPGAQASQTPQVISKEAGGYVIHQNVDEVLLSVTVLDSKDHLVTTLAGNDFKVSEDGVPQKVTVFRHEDLPVSLGILVDDSGSMQSKRAAVTKAALDLVRLLNPQDETFIVNFAEEPFLDQDFTSDLTKLNDGLSHIEARGGTALYDAVSASADHMAKTAKRSRQVLLIITDGQDNDSTSTLEETVRRVQDLGGPVVYAIGLLFNDSPRSESRPAKRALDLLAKETGGVAYFPKSLAEIDDVSAQVARDIRNQYVLGYHSTKPPEQGGFRTVKVEVTAKGYGRLSARTRTGYYPATEAAKSSGKAITETAPAK
jgi:VWFA-related protein